MCGQILILAKFFNPQELLGVNIDRNLKFNHYTLKQGNKAARKLNVLTRICKFMSLDCWRVAVFNLSLHTAP